MATLKDIVGGVVNDIRSDLALEVSSDLSPPVDVSFAPRDPNAPPSWASKVLGVVHFKLAVVDGSGGVVASYAPAGEPAPPATWLPMIVLVATVAGVVGVGVWGLVRFLK